MNDIKCICNAFSLQMVKPAWYKLDVVPMTNSEFEDIKNIVPSAVGHADTAAVLGVSCNRVNVSLDYGDTIVVAQLQGGRLPEGVTTLPEGFTFKYFTVEVLRP